MENNQGDTQKSKTKKIVLFSLGTLALGTLTFFGIKFINKSKNNTNDDTDNQESNPVDIKKSISHSTANKPHPRLPAAHANDAFPLKVGTKGNNIKILQGALLRTYGVGILPKYGADGYFGNELESALRAKGYGIPLQESEFKKITQEKKEEPLKKFDPASVAKGIYSAMFSNDYLSALTLLKSIGTGSNYILVSEKFKQYYIKGVRQTLVNGMLNVFTEKSQKENTKQVFKNMGLSYDGSKWSV